LVIGSRTGTTFTSGSVTGNVTLGANSTIGIVTMSTNSVALTAGSSTGDANSTLDISGGTNSINTVTMGVNTVAAGFATGSNTDATINITGGATTVNTAFTMGAQNSALNAATTVNTAISNLNISAGSLTLAGSTNLTMGQATLDAQNAATASISITGTGSLTVGGNIQYTDAALGTETNTVTLNGGTLDMTNGNIGGAGGTGAGAGIITFNAQSGTLRNLAQLNGGGTLTKTTIGTLIFDTANSYTGATVVSAGILAISHGSALGGTTNGTSVAAGGTLALSGGITVNGESLTLTADGTANNASLSNASGSNTWTGNLTVDTGTGSGRALIESAAGSNLLVSGNINLSAGSNDFVLRGDGNGEISGQITGSQRLFKSSVGTGTWILSGDNSSAFTGRTTISNGAIQISSEANLGAAPGTYVANQLTLGGGSTNGTIKTTASTALSANRGVTLGAGGGTFETAAATTLTVNGVIAGTTGVLNKTGDGTLVLTAANTYAGTTNVSAGTLQVGNGTAGSLTGAGGVNVTYTSGTATKLSGSGSIAGSTILGSGTILAPGVGDTNGSNQTLNFTTVEVQSGGQVQFSITNRTEQLGSSDLSALTDALTGGSYTTVAALFTTGQLDAYKTTAPGNHDFVNISGTFTINADNLAAPLFKVVNRTGFPYTTAAPSVGDVFNLMDWTTLSYSGTNTSLTAANFDFTGAGFTGEFKFDTSAFATHGILVVVPEPSRACFILIGLLGLMMRRRRAL
jgi:autotransporter-associated beta strand protein